MCGFLSCKTVLLCYLPDSRKIQQDPAEGTLLFLVCHSGFTTCTLMYHKMCLLLKDVTTDQNLEAGS